MGKIMRSTSPLIIFLLSFLGATKAATEDCEKVKAEFDECAKDAYEDYKKAFQAGNDGRPDWMARKSCNYMTAAVEECGDKLVGECDTCEEVTNMKDEQLKKVLKNVKSSVKEWDSNKCPATKAHMERVKALEKGETIEAKCKSPVDDNVDGGVATAALTVSVLSALLLPLFA